MRTSKRTSQWVRLVICFLFSTILLADYSPDDDSISKEFRKYLGAAKFLEKLNNDEVQTLKFHEDAHVSIFCAWEMCIRAKRTSALAQEFAGFVAGKLNTPIPNWWKKALESHYINERMWPKVEGDLPAEFVCESGITRSTDLKFKFLDPNTLALSNGNLKFPITELFGDKDEFYGDVGGCLSVDQLKDGGTIVTSSSPGSFDLRIWRFSSMHVKLWETNIPLMHQKRMFGRIPQTSGMLQTTVSKNKLTIWTVDGVRIGVDVLSLEDGTPMARFTTFYGTKNAKEGAAH